MTARTVAIPGYIAGTWVVDPVHSDVSFTVRHLGIAKVRGHFDDFEAEIVTGADPAVSSVKATIRTASFNTGNEQRDAHVRSEGFLGVEAFPTITFVSTAVRLDGDRGFIDGDLTIRGVTRPVTLDVELNGFGDHSAGGKAVGFSASTEINRHDFGVDGGPGAAVVGDQVRIMLEVEAVQR